MKFKKIDSVCRALQQIILYDAENGNTVKQFLGTDDAMYALNGIPYIRENNLPALFDLTPKQQDSWDVAQYQAPSEINFDDYDDGEVFAEKLPFSIAYQGSVLKPVKTDDGIFFIENVYLSPFQGLEVEFYLRHDKNAKPYFVIKEGLLLDAVIYPTQITKGLLSLLKMTVDLAQ